MATKKLAATLASALIVGGMAAGIVSAVPANATTAMYAVGTDIQPGHYRYVVTGADWGAWHLCSNTMCRPGNGMINMDMIEGAGATGYLDVTSDVRYVQLINLRLT